MRLYYRLLFLGITFIPGLLHAQTNVEPAPAPKDNFFWTHRKERHWQSWVGVGPLLGTCGTDLCLHCRGYGYASPYFFYKKLNQTAGYSLAQISLPVGLGAQFNQVYRANRWFGMQFGAEGFALYRTSKWYAYDSVDFQTHIDPNAPNGGPYTYYFSSGPPNSTVERQQFCWGWAAQFQFLFQVPGGRFGIRQGLRMQTFMYPGVVQGDYASPNHHSFSFLQSVYFGITPQLRIEVQHSWESDDQGVRAPALGYTPYVSTYNSYWLFTLQYSLKR